MINTLITRLEAGGSGILEGFEGLNKIRIIIRPTADHDRLLIDAHQAGKLWRTSLIVSMGSSQLSDGVGNRTALWWMLFPVQVVTSNQQTVGEAIRFVVTTMIPSQRYDAVSLGRFRGIALGLENLPEIICRRDAGDFARIDDGLADQYTGVVAVDGIKSIRALPAAGVQVQIAAMTGAGDVEVDPRG